MVCTAQRVTRKIKKVRSPLVIGLPTLENVNRVRGAPFPGDEPWKTLQ